MLLASDTGECFFTERSDTGGFFLVSQAADPELSDKLVGCPHPVQISFPAVVTSA